MSDHKGWQVAVAGVALNNLRDALRMYHVRIMWPDDPVMVVVVDAGSSFTPEDFRQMFPRARFCYTKEQLEAQLGLQPTVRIGAPANGGKPYGSPSAGTYTPPSTHYRR